MNRILIVIFFVAFSQLAVFAQGESSEKIKSMRIAFITEKLQLSPEESQNFWPVYNNYSKKLNEINRKLYFKDHATEMSEKDAMEFLNTKHAYRKQEISLEQEYTDAMLEILPAKKVALLYFAELEFRRKILRDFRRKYKGRQK